MKKTKELAELVGIILGDGSIYSNESKRVHQLVVTGHSEDDRDYLMNYVKPLIENLLGIRVGTRLHATYKELFLYVSSKSIILELKEIGLFPGNKKKNNIGIPSWIFRDKEYVKSCLRGLIDTDGSLYPKTLNHPCSSIWFKSCIPALRKDIDESFKILNFHPSKWTNTNSIDTKQCCLGKSKEVIRYYKEVGFKNTKHLKRFRRFIRAPVV